MEPWHHEDIGRQGAGDAQHRDQVTVRVGREGHDDAADAMLANDPAEVGGLA